MLRAETQKHIDIMIKKKKPIRTPILVDENAVITYRDFESRQRWVTQDFTEDIDTLQRVYDAIEPSSGIDTPEDVQGAFIHALYGVDQVNKALNWLPVHHRYSGHILWLSDAPPHGKMFVPKDKLDNPPYSDQFPESCPKEWDKIFEKMHEMQIDLIIGMISEDTKYACGVFEELGQKHGVLVKVIDLTEQIAHYNSISSVESAAKLYRSANEPVSQEKSFFNYLRLHTRRQQKCRITTMNILH